MDIFWISVITIVVTSVVFVALPFICSFIVSLLAGPADATR